VPQAVAVLIMSMEQGDAMPKMESKSMILTKVIKQQTEYQPSAVIIV